MAKKKEETASVTVIRSTFAEGKALEVGKTIELDADVAKQVVTSGKAVYAAKITPEDKAKIQEEEARLKEKEDRKANLKPIELANSGKAQVKKDKESGNQTDPNELAIKKLVDDHTAKQLQGILDDLEVKYETDANKATLAALILDNKKED